MGKVEPGRRECKGCGKSILFAQTEDGKIIPLDTIPPTYLLERDLTGVLVAVRSDAVVSHFATCPKANDFSKGKKP